jgi:hypothetical protein
MNNYQLNSVIDYVYGRQTNSIGSFLHKKIANIFKGNYKAVRDMCYQTQTVDLVTNQGTYRVQIGFGSGLFNGDFNAAMILCNDDVLGSVKFYQDLAKFTGIYFTDADHQEPLIIAVKANPESKYYLHAYDKLAEVSGHIYDNLELGLAKQIYSSMSNFNDIIELRNEWYSWNDTITKETKDNIEKFIEISNNITLK